MIFRQYGKKRVSGTFFKKEFIKSYRMHLIQRVFEKGVSQLSNARLLIRFKQFPASVGGFEVEKSTKHGRNV